MRALVYRCVIAALLIGPIVGFVDEATAIRKAIVYDPPISLAEMDNMKNLTENQVETMLRGRKEQMTAWEWLKDSIHYAYFWKRVMGKSVIPVSGIFLACL